MSGQAQLHKYQFVQGHHATAAALRGHQLLATVRGKKEGEEVFAGS